MKMNPQPPIETLTGSSCPAPNSSRESAKALTPVDASPKTPLKQKKKIQCNSYQVIETLPRHIESSTNKKKWNCNKMRLHIKL